MLKIVLIFFMPGTFDRKFSCNYNARYYIISAYCSSRIEDKWSLNVSEYLKVSYDESKKIYDSLSEKSKEMM